MIIRTPPASQILKPSVGGNPSVGAAKSSIDVTKRPAISCGGLLRSPPRITATLDKSFNRIEICSVAWNP